MRAFVTACLLLGLAVFSVITPGKPAPATTLQGGVHIGSLLETARLRAHFDSVLAEMADRDVSQLTPDQRDRRAALMNTLRVYRDRAEYPRNYESHTRRPSFVDHRTGVHCAVAFLLHSTARADIVERVRATNNNVFVADLAGDTAFTSWLDTFGLTLPEAARIQPTYSRLDVVDDDPPNKTYRHASSTAMVTSGLFAIWNASQSPNGENHFTSSMGVVVGVATIGLGIVVQAFPPPSRSLAIGNVAAGTASVIISGRGLMRRERSARRPDEPTESRSSSRGAIETSIVPTISFGGQKTAGVAVSVKF